MNHLLITALLIVTQSCLSWSLEAKGKEARKPSSSATHSKAPKMGLANTEASPEASSEIPDKREFPLNESISPCQNFHDYVCSKAEAAFKLREDRSRHIFSFSDSEERLLKKKREFLKNIGKESHLSERGEGLQANFLACMDQKAGAKEERRWIAELKMELSSITTIEQLRKYLNDNQPKGRPVFLQGGEVENVSNPEKYDFYIGVSLMGLPDHSYYDNKELMKEYRQRIIDFFTTVNSQKNKQKAIEQAEALVNLEREFIKIYPKREDRRRRWSEIREIKSTDFIQTYPNLAVEPLLKLIPETTLIRLPIPEAMKFFNDLMVQENLNLLKNLLLYRVAHSVMDDAYPAYFQKVFDFNHKYFGGPAVRPVRDERCTMSIMDTFAKELDEVLLPRLFPDFPEEKFKSVVESVRKTIVSGINQNSWLSPQAKKAAGEKMATARLQLVKPLNEAEWDFLPIVKYSSKRKIQNEEQLSAAIFRKTLDLLTKPVDDKKWEMGPLTINAYYSRSANKFVMPLGILQPPFYNPGGSDIENLGAVGAVVGHELGHGIDDEGSKFDMKGRLYQWMTDKDLAEFKSRSSKLIEQFDKIGHNGSATLGENIGDLVGVTFAYRAAFPKDQGSVEDKKSFFVSYARLWCGVARKEFEEKLLKTDSHSLGWARINQPVKHLKSFHEVFQCKQGDPMFLPEADRVSIW